MASKRDRSEAEPSSAHAADEEEEQKNASKRPIAYANLSTMTRAHSEAVMREVCIADNRRR